MFCPVAEKLLGDLVRDGKALGLTCMVDYFQTNPDNPASALCVRRQESYALSLKSGPLYTPQAVVNGTRDAVGYRQTEIEDLLDSPIPPARIGMRMEEGGDGAEKGVILDLPALAASKDDPARSLSLEIVTYRKKAQESGLQARPLTNLVTAIDAAGEWDGKAGARTLPLPSAWNAESDPQNRGLAVFVFDPATHGILAAGDLSLAGEGSEMPTPQNIDAGE